MKFAIGEEIVDLTISQVRALTGMPPTPLGRRKNPVICLDDLTVYESLNDCAKAYGTSPSTICNYIRWNMPWKGKHFDRLKNVAWALQLDNNNIQWFPSREAVMHWIKLR